MQQFKRSRLERKTDNEITRKTIFLGLITIAVFVLLLVFGLPLLIRFSVFLGDTRNRNSAVQSENTLPPLPPRIFVPYEATNSASINIEGSAEAKTKVELMKDDVAIETVEVDESGEFVIENVSLDEGDNIFIARAVSEDGLVSELSKSLEIELDQKVPELTMTNPSEDSVTVDYADFDVVGVSEPGVSVTVNGRVALVDAEGNFKLKMQLVPGKNEMEVVVRDLAGNETKKKITVTYDI